MKSGWVSCTETANPNVARGSGHWILFDFNSNYLIENIHLWNLNDPSMLTNGIKRFVLDISADGQSWEEVGTYDLEMANGSSFYIGQAGPSLGNVETKYVLITGIENHGGTCFGISELKFNLAQASLPVTLVDQAVSCNDSQVERMLSWTTENEINNEGYKISRSYDGQVWSQIAFVKGKNNKNRINYTYKDKTASENDFYYQITQYDFDGLETAFEVLKSDCNYVSSALVISPNPVSEVLNYTYDAIGEDSYEIMISDMAGRIIYQNSSMINFQKGGRQIMISDLAAGSYILTIKERTKIARKMFQKL
jgi:hypothetical protein